MGKKPVEISERQKNEPIFLAEKRKIINEAEKGVSYALIISQFQLNSPSVISMIMSRKEKVVVSPRKIKKSQIYSAIDDFKLFALQSNNKLFTEKMLGIIYQMEKLVDLKPVNLIQRRLNF